MSDPAPKKRKVSHASARAKGQQAERDVCALLQPAVDAVFLWNKEEPPKLCRNLQQTQDGGFDISGLEWLALEVKHHAKVTPSGLAAWWAQTLEQAGDTREPVLFYRGNGIPFRVRFLGWWQAESVAKRVVVDVSVEDFLEWFHWRAHFDLLKVLGNRSKVG